MMFEIIISKVIGKEIGRFQKLEPKSFGAIINVLVRFKFKNVKYSKIKQIFKYIFVVTKNLYIAFSSLKGGCAAKY